MFSRQSLRNFKFKLEDIFNSFWNNIAAIAALHVLWMLLIWAITADDPDVPFADFLQMPHGSVVPLSVPAIPILTGILLAIYYKAFHRVFNVNHAQKLASFWRVMPGCLALLILGFSLHFYIGAALTIFLPTRFFWRLLMTESSQERHVRGAQVGDIHRVRYDFEQMRPAHDPGFLFGGVTIPSKEATTHMLMVGASGSGKTLSLRLLMQSFIPQITPNSGKRAIIYDYTRTALPLLEGMGACAKIHILNLFDARASAWNIAADIRTLADAAELAHILAPAPSVNEKSDKFFRDAAQSLLEGMTVFLQRHAPEVWTLRDLVLGLSSIELATALLMSDPATRHYLGALGTEKTAANILSSVLVEIKNYRIIAALADNAASQFSLRGWLQGGSILLLGASTQAEHTLSAYNRLVFTRAGGLFTEHIQPESSPDPNTFFILDELPQLGTLEKLINLAEVIRARGGVLALGFQSYERLKRIYGEHDAATLIGQIRNKAILRLDEPETAEWASRLIGEQQLVRKSGSYSRDADQGSLDSWAKKGLNAAHVIEKVVLPSELLNIKPIEWHRGVGLTGYYLTRSKHSHTYSIPELKERLMPPDEGTRGFMPVPDHFQELRPWNEEDWERLNITTLMMRLERDQYIEELDEQYRDSGALPSAAASSTLPASFSASSTPSSSSGSAGGNGGRTIDISEALNSLKKSQPQQNAKKEPPRDKRPNEQQNSKQQDQNQRSRDQER